MPIPLALLTGAGDAGDPTTMRTAWAAAAAVVMARWWWGRWSREAIIMVRTCPFVAFSVLMLWLRFLIDMHIYKKANKYRSGFLKSK